MRIPLEEFFDEDPPLIRFADGSFLEGSEYVSRRRQPPPYPKDKIEYWDWTGTIITEESQGTAKRKSSIQYRVIQELIGGNYDVVFDDDDSGEAADVVAVRMEKEEARITVKFYHCKFSKKRTAGARIEDLYAVCGQAQKSVRWMETERSSDLFNHLLRRDPREKDSEPISRLEKGERETLHTLVQMSKSLPVDLEIYIVQPGLSKALVTDDQLRLLSVTETYLMETYGLPFGVIASD